MAKCRKYWTWKSNNKNNISNNFGNAPTLCFTLIAHMTNIRQEQAKLRAFFFMCLYSMYLVISSEILYNSNREENIIKAWEFRIDSALLKKDSVRLVGMIGHYDFCVGLKCQKNLLYLLFQAKMTNSNQHFRNILRLLAFYWTFCMSLNI